MSRRIRRRFVGAVASVARELAIERLENRTYLANVPLSGIADQLLKVTGRIGQAVPITFSYESKSAAAKDEMGIVQVDDAAGTIGALHPGDAGYTAAALTAPRYQKLFSQTSSAGATTTVNLIGGGIFELSLISNGSITSIPAAPLLLSIPKASADGADHMHGKLDSTPQLMHFFWEDSLHTISGNFMDVVLHATRVQSGVTLDFVPIATADSATLTGVVSQSINVVANDLVVGNLVNLASVTVGTAPAHGTTSVDPQTGNITYTPTPQFSGKDSFTYTVQTLDGVTSNVALVSVNVMKAGPFFTSTQPVTFKPSDCSIAPLSDEIFTVIAPQGQNTSFTVNYFAKKATFANEIGIVRLDDFSGLINGLTPGSASWARAALSSARSQLLYGKSDGVGKNKTVTLIGGGFYAYFLVQKTTLASARATNPDDLIGSKPLTFFTITAANPDHFKHSKLSINNGSTSGIFKVSFEDTTGGGDRDYDDAILAFHDTVVPYSPRLFTYHLKATDPAGNSIQYSLVSGPRGAAVDPISGLLIWDAPAGQSGNFNFVVAAKDSKGVIVDQPFTLDLLPCHDENPPSVSTPDLRAASDSGSSSTDNYTNVAKPTFDVAADTGTTLTLYADNQPVGTAVSVGGTASFTLTTALTDNVHHLFATASDGSQTSTSGTLDLTIDTQAPGVTLSLDPASDTGTAGDNHTTTQSVTLDGVTEAMTPVVLTQGNLPTTSGLDGKFSFSGISLNVGANNFNAFATDLAGNIGHANLTITRDRTLSLTAVLFPQPTAALQDGTPLTNSKNISVMGVTSPGATVVLDARGLGFVDGSTIAATDGSYTLPVTLSEGLNTLKVQASDGHGQNQQATLKVSLDDVPPSVSTPDLNAASDSGSSSTDNYTNVTKPTLNVAAETGSHVTLYIDNVPFASATSVSGAASFTLTNALTDDVHHFFAKATDAAGNTGTSGTLDVTVDTHEPAVTLSLDPASDTAPVGDGYTTTTSVTLDGQTEATTPVTLTQGNLSTTSDPTGKFSFSGISLASGANTFHVSATDLAGNVGNGSATVTLDASPVNVNLVEGTHYHVVYNQTITIPAVASILTFTFDTLNFDLSSHFIKDAFEANLIGSDGTPDTYTIGGGHDAYFNHTEGQSAALAKGVNVSPAAGSGTTVSVDLSQLPAGEHATLELRLVNDDTDTTTSVHISNVQVIAGTLPVGGTMGPVGVLATIVPAAGSLVNPSNPTATTTLSGTTAEVATTATSHGPLVPSATMALTAAGKAAGFTLTTFATDFPVTSGIVGPLGVAFPDGGGVMVTDYSGNVRILPNDNDGQNANTTLIRTNYGSGNAIGLAQVGQKFYMSQQTGNAILELNPDGTFKQYIVSGIPFATGIAAAPNGLLYVSTGTGIHIVDPIAKTDTPFVSNTVDGLGFSADGTVLYAAAGTGDILGFDVATKTVVFDSGPIPGGIDGQVVGAGALAGNIFVNINNGNLVEVNLTTKEQTLIATGGSRGDFVVVDPTDGSLMVTQTDRVLRLTAPQGSTFGGLPVVQVAASSPQSQVSSNSAVLISGHATTAGTKGANGGNHGPFVPSTAMTLTSAGASAGYTLTTFASGFPFGISSSGPIGWALLPSGNVMVSDVAGNLRIFPTDNDGQTVADAVIAQNFGGSNGDGFAQIGSHIYVALQGEGSVIELNTDGTRKQTIATGLSFATGLAAAPNGLLYVSGLSSTIYEVDPIAKTTRTFAIQGSRVDGLDVSADGAVLYAESDSHIYGFKISDGSLVFDSGFISGGADGMAVGVGKLAGNIFVNTNGGTVIQVNISTLTQTLLATGGSRGDLVAVDPSDGSLLLTQSERVLRLTASAGGGFGKLVAATIKSVTVNGVTVDALDNNGNFFTRVNVQPGQNNFAVVATDNGGRSGSVTLSIAGVSSGSSTVTALTNLSATLAPKFGRTSLDESTGAFFTQIAALNSGQFAVNTPLFVGITHISDPTVTVLTPDGYTDTGVPYFDYSSLVTGNHLEAGAQTGFREIGFSNPNTVQFTFDLQPLGQLNAPPQITSVPVLDAAVNQPYKYPVIASDPDSDPLAYSLSIAPTGMSINPSTGVITYTPGAIGLQDVLINVSDGRGGTVQQQYQLNINPVLADRPPVFTTTPPVDATVGHAYSYGSGAVDPDADPVNFSLVPTSHIVPAQAVPIFNPGFELHVLPDGGVGDAFGWNVVGSGGDYNPATSSFPSVPEGQNVSFSNGSTVSQVLKATAIAGATYTLQVQVGASVDQNFSGYAIQLWAGGQMLSQSTSPNPVSHSGTFVTSIVTVTVNPGDAAVGKALEIRLVGNGVQEEFDAVGLTMTPQQIPLVPIPAGAAIDPNTGVLTWTPVAGQVGPQLFTVVASDGRGGTASQVFTVNVAADSGSNVSDHNPIFTSTPPTAPAVVAKDYRYIVTAVDPDNDPLTFSIPAPPSGMTIDPTSGVLGFAASAGQVGSVHVVVVVSDGHGGTATQPFDISVVTSGTNFAPRITSIPSTTAESGKLYLYAATATDLNADPLTFSLPTAPSEMTIDPVLGLIRWTPVAADIGQTRQVSVLVTDGRGGSDTQSFGIAVVSQVVNHPPVITSVPPDSATPDKIYRYGAAATDTDNDFIIWSLDAAPAGMSVDAKTGTVVWQPLVGQTGPHSVVLHASDGRGGEAVQNFTVTVSTVNHAPGISSAPPTLGIVGGAYVYNVRGVDPDGDALSYSLTTAPTGMTIDEGTGVISWKPISTQFGSNNVVVEVTDTHGAFCDQKYSVMVVASESNRPPSITSRPRFTAEPLQPYTYAMTAVDPDGDPVHFVLNSGPQGMTVDSTTGLVSWTPTATQVGRFVVIVAALDPENAGAGQGFFVVSAPNHAPQITSTPVTSVLAGTSYLYTVRATDQDGDPLTFHLDNAPNGMTIDANGNISWSPGAADVGSPPVQVTVSDPEGAKATQSFNIAVNADTGAPQVDILVDRSSVNISDVVNIRVATADDAFVVNKTLVVDGNPIALDANGSAAVRFTHAGIINMTATATDSAGNVAHASSTEQVIDPTDTSAPDIDITSPGEDDTITSPVDVIGTVNDPNLLFYTLSIAPADGSSDFKEFFRSTSNVINGKLGTLDPTLLTDDTYILRLDAENAGGHANEIDFHINVTGKLKLGDFGLSFTDLQTPVSGVPIYVGRKYDSFNSNRQGDFGYGWTLDFGNTRLSTSLAPSPDAEVGAYPAFIPNAHVYITLPDGTREGFTFIPTPAPGLKGGFLHIIEPAFQADVGVTDTLTVDPFDLTLDTGSGEYTDYNGSLPYNPADADFGSGQYTLTTKTGLVYKIDGNTGSLNSVTDTNGNTLTYSKGGISSSSGVKVTFVRDVKGRISQVIDPLGETVSYTYDAAGNLSSVTNRNGNVTHYTYRTDLPHYLDQVIDPLGRVGTRTNYGPDGRIISITNADGKVINLAFNVSTASSSQTLTDALGNSTTYSYDNNGNVVDKIAPDGAQTVNTYDTNNNLLTQTDALGFKTTYTYDSKGNVLSATDPNGKTVHTTYSSLNQAQAITDPMGGVMHYNYDQAGNILSYTDQAGIDKQFLYDAAGNPVGLTDASGSPIIVQYNGSGQVSQQLDAEGTLTSNTYDADGNLTSQTTSLTTPNGVRSLVTTYTFDADGDLITLTDPEGNITHYEYDALDELTAQVDPAGNRTQYQYDTAGNPTAIILPDGSTLSTTYDADGNKLTDTDGGGRITRYVYDSNGRLIKTVYPDDTPADDTDNPHTQIEYDLDNQVTARIDANGNRTEYTYDADGNQIKIHDALGHNTTFTYDADGHQTSVTDPLLHTTTFQYDQAGRKTATIFADGSEIQSRFNDRGLDIEDIDALGNKTDYTYDDLGRLATVTDALGNVTTYGYDEAGNQISQTDAAGDITRYEYDGIGDQTATILPLGQKFTQMYGPAGNVIQTTDFDGQTTTYTYNSLNEMTAEHLADGSNITFTYTPDGQRASETDSRGTTTYSYDSRDNLLARTDPDGTVISYTYDNNGNPLTESTPAGTTHYTYDALNHLKSVTNPNGATTTYTYDADGNLVQTDQPNGVIETRQYDLQNRLTLVQSTGPGNTPVTSFAYTLDADGDITHVNQLNGRSVDYIYDALNELTQEKITDPSAGNRTIHYTYNNIGERSAESDTVAGNTTYSYDANGRLLSQTTAGVVTAYTYDNNGNTLTATTSPTNKTTYTYDAQGRLASATVVNGASTSVVTYLYDVDGIQVARTQDGVVTRFLIDNASRTAQVAMEYAPGGAVIAAYTRGNGLISQTRGSATSYYQADSQGSTAALTNSAGVKTDTYIYDAFGNILNHTGASVNEYQFAGEVHDTLTNLTNLRARYMNPANGLFLGRDPFAGLPRLPLSLQPYLYTRQNPVNMTDPSGRFAGLDVAFALSISDILDAATDVSTIEEGEVTIKQIQFWVDIGILLGTIAANIISLDTGGSFNTTFEIVKYPITGVPSSLPFKNVQITYTAAPDAVIALTMQFSKGAEVNLNLDLTNAKKSSISVPGEKKDLAEISYGGFKVISFSLKSKGIVEHGNPLPGYSISLGVKFLGSLSTSFPIFSFNQRNLKIFGQTILS